MNKKKALTLVAALTLVGVVGIGATLAYFTDSDAATNVITMGNVDVDLDEPNFDPDDPDTPENENDDKIDDILPGQEIEKDPTITVKEGSADAYIRAKIEIVEEVATGKEAVLDDDKKAELLGGISIKDGWYLSADGYYYYNEVVTFETKTERTYIDENSQTGYSTEEVEGVVLFDLVNIPESWGNEVADLTFEIVVSAEAIQADNFTPVTAVVKENEVDVTYVTAWQYEDGTSITADTYKATAEEDAQ